MADSVEHHEEIVKRDTPQSGEEDSLPSPDHEPARYRGRPLVLVLESYVLAAIGALPAAQNPRMARMVARAFGSGPDWMASVRRALGLPPSVDAELRAMWEENQRVTRAQGIELKPIQFAKLVVDQNFAELIAQSGR